MPLPSMSPEAPTESLKRAMQLCRRYPDTAGKFTGLVNGWEKYAAEKKKMDLRPKKDVTGSGAADLNVYALPTLPRTYNTDTRRLEWNWGVYVFGGLGVCAKSGPAFCIKWATTNSSQKNILWDITCLTAGVPATPKRDGRSAVETLQQK